MEILHVLFLILFMFQCGMDLMAQMTQSVMGFDVRVSLVVNLTIVLDVHFTQSVKLFYTI